MKSIKKFINVGEWIFKLSYLCLVLATFNAYIYVTPIQSVLVKVCLGAGALVFLGRVICFRDYIKMPYWYMLVLFCGSFVVSIGVNYKYGMAMSDMKWVVWTSVLFFLLYVCDTKKDTDYYKREFNIFSHIMIVYGVIAFVASVCLMFGHYGEVVATPEGEHIVRGFQWGRLWGIYTDPNYGGVVCVLLIVLSIYYACRKKGWIRYIYIANVIINYVFMTFTDSRTAELALIVGVIFMVIMFCLERKEWRVFRRVITAILIMIVTIGVIIPSSKFLKAEYNFKIQKEINIEQAKKAKEAKKVPNAAKKSQAVSDKENRKKNLEQDVSNGRFHIWKSGIEVWKTSPVVGVGYNSILPYAKEHTPDTYILSKNYMSLHNGYLNILVYQGLLGAIIAGVFFLSVIFYQWKCLFKIKEEDRSYIAILYTCVLVVGVSMMFLAEGLYTNSPGAYVLWAFLGYIMHYNYRMQKVDTL